MSQVGPHAAVEDLAVFAGLSEDMLRGAQPEDHTWLWVDTAPWDALGGRDTWVAFWDQAQEEQAGYWDGLLDLGGTWDPLTVALVPGDEPGEACWANVWDGNHRLGATAVLEMEPRRLVLGVPHEVRWEDLPTAWQQVPALQRHFGRPAVEPASNARPRLR